jgi:peptide/nickel transport system substrate-binding protein
MAANPDYWDGRPAVDEIVMIPMPSEPARASALASGEIDMVPVLPPTFVPRLSRDPNLKIVPVKSNRATFLGFNHHDPVLGDLKVRQAIDCAIDRDKITKVLLRGFGEPVGQVDPPVLFGYDPTILPTAYDLAKAKRLLAESSYKGETIPFDYPTNRLAFGEEVAQAIGGYLQEIGLKLELRHAEFAAFFPNWLSNKFPGIYFYGLGMSVMDSDLLLGFDYESKISHGYWSSPEVDDLIRRQRGATDPRERAALLSKIWTISRDNVVYAPLYAEIQVYGFRKGVEYTPRADERLRFQDARVTPS